MVGLAVVLIATQRGSAIRKGLIGATIGVFVHLLLDAAWASPEAFWWPLFGTEFPRVFDSDLPSLLSRMLSDPLVWAGEVLGLGYLVFLWRRYLGEAGDLRRFATVDGAVAMRPETA